MKTVMLLAVVFLAAGVAVLPAAETLQLKLDKPRQFTAGASTVKIDGAFVDGKYLATGDGGIAVPAGPFLGERAGTVLLNFQEREQTDLPLVPRYVLTLRTRSRLSVSFVLFRSESRATFSFSDREHTFSHRFKEPFTYNRDHQIAFTYDGATVCFYFDGVLVAQGAQPLPLPKEKLDKLYVGPVKDQWIAQKHWGDVTLASELRLWNEALTPRQIAEISGVKFVALRESHRPRLAVPALVGAAPTIDGELDESAWKYAASMPRLIAGNAVPKSGTLPPHRFMLAFDQERLYLGFNSVFPGGTVLQSGQRRLKDHEGEVWGTESFELYLACGSHLYRFGGNVAGGSVESRDGDRGWDGPWSYRTTLKMRIDDTLFWQGEVAIPWKTLGLDAAPRTPLAFNFCRTWRLPGCSTHSSLNLAGGGYAQPEGLVDLCLVPKGAVVQVLQQNDPAQGNYLQEFAVAGAKTVNYRLALGRLDGSAAPLELVRREIGVGANEVYVEKLASRITNPGYDCLLYSLSQGSEIAMRAIVPFELNADFFTLKAIFLSEKLVIDVNRPVLARKFGGQFNPRLLLTDPAGKAVYSESAEQNETTIPFARSRTPGGYKLALVNADNGEPVQLKELHYPGIGSWEKMTFDNRIIPPLSRLESRTGDKSLTAAVWNRTYRWEGGLFPAQISSSRLPMLAAPVALLINGALFSADRFAVGSAADHRVEFTADGENDCGKIRESGWIEYDGFLWQELELVAKKALNDVRLVVRLPNSIAKYVHAAGLGAWSSQITAAIRPGERALGFFPVVWLGMEDKGLCFFAESCQSWRVPKQNCMRLVRQADQTALEVCFAAGLKAGETLRWDFGFLASPVKPLPKNYPLNTLSSSHVVAMNRPGRTPTSDVVYLADSTGADLGSFFGDLPTELGARVRASHARGAAEALKFHGRPVPYTCARFLSIKYPEMAAFKDEWGFLPEIAMDYNDTGHFVYDCCPTTGANAFFIERVREMYRRTPDLRGIYFDFGTAHECNNPLHACRQRYPLRAMREFYRRVALAQLDAGIREPVIVVHNTDEVSLPAFTFVTHLLNGERVRQASSTLLHDRKDILDSYDLDVFAAELGSLPFGLTNSVYMPFDKLLAKHGGTEEDAPYKFRMTKAAMAAILVHHTLPCLWRMHFGIFDKLVRIYDNFQVPQARFVGYWEEPSKVLVGQNIYVSVYRHASENRLLAVIGHVGKEHRDQDLEIAFDFAKLNVQNLTRAVEKMTESDPDYEELFRIRKANGVAPVRAPLELGDFGSKVLSFHGNVLKLHLDFHSFAVVELSP